MSFTTTFSKSTICWIVLFALANCIIADSSRSLSTTDTRITLTISPNQKFLVLRALERLQRRVAEILYKKQKWFNWVREKQDSEEAQREKESKRVKLEAALFKRHMEEVGRRMEKLRIREEKKRQDKYLDEAYQARLAQEDKEESDDDDWDPIEDVVEDERGNFVDLIRHFLWQELPSVGPNTEAKADSIHGPLSQSTDGPLASPTGDESATSKSTKGSKNKKKAKNAYSRGSTSKPLDDTAKPEIETRAEMRRRLKDGSGLNIPNGTLLSVGSIENPGGPQDKTFAFNDNEIEGLLEEVFEIKHLLFCRLLISYASLLPAALPASSVEEFLNDKDVPEADLRDICRRMEDPGLQEIRDACADLSRGDDEGENEEGPEDELQEKLGKRGLFSDNFRPGKLPKSWSSRYEERFRNRKKDQRHLRDGKDVTEAAEGTPIDFGVIDDQCLHKPKKMRVKVCGRSIYNYPSDTSMTRGGWLQFCVLAKNSNLHDAVYLCRGWDEFYELNVLAIFRYFPGADWASWGSNRIKQQFLLLVRSTYSLPTLFR